MNLIELYFRRAAPTVIYARINSQTHARTHTLKGNLERREKIAGGRLPDRECKHQRGDDGDGDGRGDNERKKNLGVKRGGDSVKMERC